MSFCAKCGRQRDGTARFCGTCGAEFSDPPATSEDHSATPDSQWATPDDQWATPDDQWATPDDQWAAPRDATRFDPPPDATRFDPPVDATRMDAAAGATRADPAAAAATPDPFASWFQQDAQGGAAEVFRNDADTNWQPTQTVRATPTQPTGYPPPPFFPPAPPFPPGAQPFPPGTQPARRRRRGLFIAVAVVIVLAAGGGAYALASTLGKHPNAQPSTPPTVRASTPAVSSPPPTTQPASPTPTASASTSPSPSASPTPSLSLVAVSPGISGAAVPPVELVLSRHFQGINTRNYSEYVSGLTPQERADQPQSSFESGYATTTDSGMTLTSLSSTGSGLAATVTFTSRQDPADSNDNSACNAWTLTYYLVPSGTGYLIGPAPAGAPQPAESAC